jgi:hypothetical protein
MQCIAKHRSLINGVLFCDRGAAVRMAIGIVSRLSLIHMLDESPF